MKIPGFKPSLKQLLRIPDTQLEKFHHLTKMKKWAPFQPVENWPKSWKVVFFKEYPRFDKIFLPQPELDENVSLKYALFNRGSVRKFSQEKLTLEQISTLLYFTAGIREKNKFNASNRFYPSPGSRYALEIYFLSLNSELPNGIYHYNLKQHCLEILGGFKTLKKNYYFNQSWIYQAGCIVLITAVFERNIIKYGYRGYRHILQEAGHLGQNIYLLGSALNLAVCGIGGYVDDRLNKLLDIDGVEETVIYPLAVGNNIDQNKIINYSNQNEETD